MMMLSRDESKIIVIHINFDFVLWVFAVSLLCPYLMIPKSILKCCLCVLFWKATQ